MKSGVEFIHPDYEANAGRWEMVEDFVGARVKEKRTKYLPAPNPLDTSPEAKARYEDYLNRSVYYNFVGRTLQGLIGLAFNDVPKVEVPAGLEYVLDDIDGAGISIYQQSQATAEGVLKTGRYGLFVDYPQVDRAMSKAEQDAMYIRPTIAAYRASSIINWQSTRIGGVYKTSLVVLMEQEKNYADDGFGFEYETIFRVLRLLEGVYQVEIWRKGDKQFELSEQFIPQDGKGKVWNEIPFFFVGSTDNDSGVDDAPLYDITEVSKGHYVNSAEYEDSCFMCGQVQPVAIGITEHWLQMLKKEGVMLGSRTLFPMERDCSFSFEQADPNTMPMGAMKHKEEQLIALGAKLIVEGSQVKTATQSMMDSESSTSVLGLVCTNVSEAFTKALMAMAKYMGLNDTTCLYEINQDFYEAVADPQMVTALVQSWQAGVLPKPSLWNQFRKFGLIDPEKTDEEIKEELDSEDPSPDLPDINGDGATV